MSSSPLVHVGSYDSMLKMVVLDTCVCVVFDKDYIVSVLVVMFCHR